MQAANRDENFVTTVRVWKDLSFQDVAKKGYGDEDPRRRRNRWRNILSFTGHYSTFH